MALVVLDGAPWWPWRSQRPDLSLVQRWLSARIGEGLVDELRSTVLEHVQRQSIGCFTRSRTGALVSRRTSDVVGAQQAFTSTRPGSCPTP